MHYIWILDSVREVMALEVPKQKEVEFCGAEIKVTDSRKQQQ